MRKSFLMSILLAFLLTTCVFGQDNSDKPENWGSDDKTPVVVVDEDDNKDDVDADNTDDLPKLKPTKLRRGATMRERRAAGVTIRNIIKKTAELQKEGVLENMDKSEIAGEVLLRIKVDNPAAFQDSADSAAAAGVDWADFLASLIAFIIKMLPFILMII